MPGKRRNDPDGGIRWPRFARIVVANVLAWSVHAAAQMPPPATVAAPGSSAEADSPPRRATPAELRRLAEKLGFQRGRFVREAIGMSLDVPRGQHLLTGSDARLADTALRGESDPYLIGWIVPADKTVTDANLRIVRLRWRHDGLVAGDAAALDPTALLDLVHTKTNMPRLASSGGTLLGYDVAPVREASTLVWSEERQPDGSSTRVHDCHALRLARRGVLEISITGVDAKTAKTCTDELRTIAATVRFEPDSDYPAQIRGERLAPYSLAGLITQTQ
ncbi:MAG: hypothetical protein QM741_05960 [Rudaea sp.]|uniref:DUF2167 domain-containing protein n=1 Tax=Rudaea sp. TaxID=2136325 RepID=UPI0039E48119